MIFYKITHPHYADDEEAGHRNPAVSTATYRVPGISCGSCGPWSSSHRLRVPLPVRLDEFVGVRFLPTEEWRGARDRWAAMLGVDRSLVEPGAKLGPPTGTCTAVVAEDAVHPIPGEIWVKARVREASSEGRVTGVSFTPVQLPPGCGSKRLWELVAHGRAWRTGSSEETLRACELCGRRAFPSPRQLSVDEARWDGTDFMFLDGNPNLIVVTERVAEIVALGGFTNLVTIPLA